jgi:hypothetical protein
MNHQNFQDSGQPHTQLARELLMLVLSQSER